MMSMLKQSKAVTGFTLIEVLIAIAIFAILSILAYGGLNSVLESKQQTEQALQRLRQVQLTMTKLQRDIEQISSREGKDELGGELSMLSGGPANELLIQFTRNGWRNPAELTRSHLQRVAYRLDEDKLIRMTWPYVDRAQDSQAIETILIDNLKDLRFRFYDAEDWSDNWPDTSAFSADDAAPLPKAIEVTVEMEDWGEIVRLFRVPG